MQLQVKSTAAKLISTLAPDAMQWFRRRWGDSGTQLRILNAMLSAGFIGKVMSGPFSGLHYEGVNAFGSVLTPKLLGTYELELRDVFREIVKTKPTLSIDIGAAEGYYAVGLAMKLGDRAEIVAFEMNEAARHDLYRLAENNGVTTRIKCLGECTPSELGRLLRPDCLVLCDCEGGETELLDPLTLPELRKVAILVELHNGVVHNIADVFRDRFASSHSITHVVARERHPSDCSIVRRLRHRDVMTALSEKRKFGIQWMWMKPLSSQFWTTEKNACERPK
jgi:hypothetical protein